MRISLSVLVFLLCFICPSARPGDRQGVPLLELVANPGLHGLTLASGSNIELRCQHLAKADAATVVVRTIPTDGSFGYPHLVGLTGEQAVWIRPFPDESEVNTATLEASCSGKRLRIAFRFPMDPKYVVRDYSWNGQTLSFIQQKIRRRYVGLDKPPCQAC